MATDGSTVSAGYLLRTVVATALTATFLLIFVIGMAVSSGPVSTVGAAGAVACAVLAVVFVAHGDACVPATGRVVAV